MDERVKKKNIREPPSVPFIWEAKPGIPKKDWKPMVVYSSASQLPKASHKLIASVPFVWEEKPGKPHPNFPHVSLNSLSPKPDSILIHVASSSGYTAAINYDYDHHKNKENSSSYNVYQHGSYNDDESESITSLDHEACSFDTDESCSSVPSFLANCFVSSLKDSNVIPLQKNSLSKHNCDEMFIPSSPASSEEESSISSYATGRSSPTGSAFLECLFPLYPPKSGFLERDDEPREKVSSSPIELKAKDLYHEDHTCDMLRRPTTLGELIMMSRRRSNRRKAAQMNKWDSPKKITSKQAFGCLSFMNSSNMIEGLLKKKYYPPTLKLI